MNKMKRWLSVLMLALIYGYVSGQIIPKESCSIDNGRIIFKLDRQWTPEEKREVMLLFDLDSTVMAGVWSGKTEITVKGVTWKVAKVNNRILELSKPLDTVVSSSRGVNDVIMVDDTWAGIVDETEREKDPYGINKFTLFNVFQYVNGKARFFLPSRTGARNVYLSGSFNNWSTTQMPLHKTDTGWVINLKLKPGKYRYKYIIDGRWTPDPYNRQREDDTYGSYNSVVFCFNFQFILRGFQQAKRVVVTGSFNGWNPDELRMFPTHTGWAMPMYLRVGTYAYKFIVDGKWMPDPDNKKIRRPDGSGNFNSFTGIGDSVVFTLKGYPNARKVALAGNFNGWNAGELFMDKTAGGWQLPYALAPGVYEYKFIVDGEWIKDPSNPLVTDPGPDANSILVFQPNYTFVLDQYSDAKKVTVAGSFNGWNKDAYLMTRKDFKWVFPIRLKPGKYTYKFVVDGKWILDPHNDLWEENEYGTGNSVLWIEP